MVQAAKKIEVGSPRSNALEPMSVAADAAITSWPSAGGGPVAQLQRAIESGLRFGQIAPAPFARQVGPVEALLRTLSRTVGWAALAMAFISAGLLLR